MNPNNISEFKNLSEFQSNGSDLIFKSTKMNLQKNSYEFSIHKVSKNKMINIFLNLLYFLSITMTSLILGSSSNASDKLLHNVKIVIGPNFSDN